MGWGIEAILEGFQGRFESRPGGMKEDRFGLEAMAPRQGREKRSPGERRLHLVNGIATGLSVDWVNSRALKSQMTSFLLSQ